MAKPNRPFPFEKSAKSLQETVTRAGPAASASYTLIGGILLLGGIGYAVDAWQGTAPWGLFVGLLLGIVVGFYELVKTIWGQMTLSKVSVPVAWMVGTSVASWLVLIAATGSSLMPELVLGMAGPLASAVVTWLVLERTHATAPERLTSVMMTAFGVKVLLFALYVITILAGLGMRPKPFMVSFTGYYVGLHVVEAWFLRRLLADGVSRWPGEGRLS